MSHYENRYSSKCIFCLKDKNKNEIDEITKEHFFGKSIAKKIPTIENFSTQGVKGGSPISNITLKAVCSRCNNHILGEKIMEPATKLMVDLFSGNVDYIHKNKIALVNRYFQRMGMLVDISSSNYGLEERKIDSIAAKTNSGLTKHAPVLSESDRKEFIEKLETKKVFVEVASYIGDGGQFGFAELRSGHFVDREKFLASLSPKVKEFVMIYHKLAFIITIGGDRTLGSYPDFKLLSNFYYKEKFKLPKIDQRSMFSYLQNSIFSGPKRRHAK